MGALCRPASKADGVATEIPAERNEAGRVNSSAYPWLEATEKVPLVAALSKPLLRPAGYWYAW